MSDFVEDGIDWDPFGLQSLFDLKCEQDEITLESPEFARPQIIWLKKPLLYQMKWCLKNGKAKNQQYWVYCEESQSNFARFTMKTPSSQLSQLMINTNNNTFCIVDSTNFSTSWYPEFSLELVDTKDLFVDVRLVEDYDEPMHPYQGSSVGITKQVEVVTEDYNGRTKYPFDMMIKLKFKGRVQGWFKLQFMLFYQRRVIAKSMSSTFMLNDPRLKKLPEHKLYTPKQLRFHQIYSLCCEWPSIPPDYWERVSALSGIVNFSKVKEKASFLFPRKSTIKHKRVRGEGEKLPSAKKQATGKFAPTPS